MSQVKNKIRGEQAQVDDKALCLGKRKNDSINKAWWVWTDDSGKSKWRWGLLKNKKIQLEPKWVIKASGRGEVRFLKSSMEQGKRGA